MRKTLIKLLAVSLIISMTACGKSATPSISEIENNEPVYEMFTWPTSDIAKLLPTPKSSIGKIDWEASYGLVAYVAETSKSDYDEYVSLCEEAGFTIDYHKGEDYFRGDNSNGYHVSLSYDTDGVMFVRIDEPEDGAVTPSITNDSDDGQKPNGEENPNNTTSSQIDDDIPEIDSKKSESPKAASESNTDILTVENCEALAAMLTLDADMDSSYADFAKQYLGKTIEFDGSIDYKENHISYNPFNGNSSISEYEYDVLVSYGDYDANHQTGPTIKIENVSSRKLGYDVSKTLPSFMAVGSNVRIRVRVGSYNENTGIFEMHLESIEAR